MTFKQLKQKLEAVNMTVKKVDGEYIVKQKGCPHDDGAYFTNDLSDALATGLKIAQSHARHEDAEWFGGF